MRWADVGNILIVAFGLCMASFLCAERPIKAIIFDCDGTLVDSEEAHLAAWRRVLQNRGHDLTLERASFYTGKPGSVIAQLIAEETGDAADAILMEKRGHYRKLQEKGLPPIEATVGFVKRLAEEKERRHLKLGVASAAMKSEILSHLRHLGIEEVFDIILSGQEDLQEYSDPEGVNKPKPYIYLHAAKLLNVAPSACVVIEDSLSGVLSGKAAGCMTIAIPNRFTEAQDLSGADLKLKTLDGIDIDAFLHLIAPE